MTDGQPPGAPGSTLRRISRWSFWSSAKGILAAAAALVAILGFVLRFLPSTETCDDNFASLSNPSIGAGTLETFLERTSNSPDATAKYPRDKLDEPVKWAAVAVSVVGHKKKALTLKWSMVDAQTGVIVPPEDRTAVEFKPPGCKKTAFREEVLLPPIPTGRSVRVTFDLVDESGERLPPTEVRTPVVRAS